MKNIHLFIPGIPRPKQSVRSRIVGTGSKQFVHHYQSKAIKDEERSIKMIIKEQLPKDFVCHAGPVQIEYCSFAFPPIKSLKKNQMKQIEEGIPVWKTTKPDLTDNLMKGLIDAMAGIVYINDSQICRVRDVGKIYSNEPGIKIGFNLLDNLDEMRKHFIAHADCDESCYQVCSKGGTEWPECLTKKCQQYDQVYQAP